jgi:hypothetical protein
MTSPKSTQPTPAARARRRLKAGASQHSTGRVSRTRPVPFSKIRLTVDELIDPASIPERCLLYRQIKEAMIRRQDFPAAAWFRDLQKAHEALSGRTSAKRKARNPKQA